jgi:hypothetical protein
MINASVAHAEEKLACETLRFFYTLWQASAFGKAPTGIERAAWILRDANGNLQFQRWPSSGARNKEFWKGDVPENAVAQVHTHPEHRDPRPSSNDTEFAKKMAVPVYTITSQGVWVVSPEGKIEKVADSTWHRDLAKPCQQRRSD